MSLQFGEFELDRERRQLLRSGQPVPLEPKAYELLSLLVERRPRALSRAQIRDVVWPGVFVSESTLGVAVNAIRQALGDDARKPRFIRTVHGFGYAFCGEVAGEEGIEGEQETAKAADARVPYPGLSSFTEEDTEVFFGREAEVEALWERLRRRRLLALIGPSGAGKTSFVRAGVIPARPEGWGAIISAPGRAPSTGLGQALAQEVAGDAEAVKELLRFEDPEVAVALLRRWRQGHDEALVVVDQFEELFTLNPPETQARFAELLGRLSGDADVHVLLCLRDDFLIRCHEYEALAPVFTAELTPLLALRGEDLRRALVEPAKREGFAFEDDSLVEEMLGAVEGERGALPLLAFAVSRLWEKRARERKLLPRAAYEEIGGVAGALAQHAERTLARIGPEREPNVRELFRNLVTAQQTRAAADRDELLSVLPDPEAGAHVLDELIDARLLTSYEIRDAASHPERGIVESRAKDLMPESLTPPRTTHRIEIVHESLLRAWPRLVRWQAQDEEGALLRDQLKQAAHLWEEKGRPDDLLWTGTSEREFELWRDRYPGALTAVEDDFAQAMVHRARRRKRLRHLTAVSVVSAAMMVAAVTGVLWRRSETARRAADAEARRAEAGKLLALGQAELERYPTAALAYATRSLELTDTEEARLLALRVLQARPTAFLAPADEQADLDDVYSVAFNSTGEWLAVGGAQQVALRHRDGRAAVVVEAGFPVSFIQVGFEPGPDGDVLVANANGDVRTWSVPGGQEVRRLKVDGGGPSGLFVRPQGLFTWTTVGTRDTVRLIPPIEGEPGLVGVMDAPTLPGSDGDIDEAGVQLAYARGRSVSVRSLENWSSPPRRVAMHPSDVKGVALHPDGRTLAASDRSDEIRIWPADARSGRPPRVLEGPETPALRYDRSGRWLAAASMVPNLVRLFDLETALSSEALQLRGPPQLILYGVAFGPFSRWVATANDRDIALWPLGKRYPCSIGRHEWYVDDVAFTPDGSHLLSGSGGVGEDSTLRAWSLSANDAERDRVLWRESMQYPGIAVHPAGERVAVSTESGRVVVVPVAGGSARTFEGFSERTYGYIYVDFSPSGRRLAAAPHVGSAEDKVIRIWELEAGSARVLGPLPGAGEVTAGGVSGLAFLDEDHILASSPTHGILSFELREGRHRVLSPRPARALAVGTKGRTAFAVLGEPDELVRVDLGGGAPTRVFSCPGCASLALDSTETVVATGSDPRSSAEGIVRIGPVSGGEPYLFFTQIGSVQNVTFSPDGRWLASSGERPGVRLWPVPDVTRTPLHRRTHEEILATLRTWTNLRAVRDPESPTGWTLEPGPFPGWETVPTW